MVFEFLVSTGRAFQSLGPVTLKERPAKHLRRVKGTLRRMPFDERVERPELLVAGAPRSGVITGFTLQQFRKATKLTKDDGSDYRVAMHVYSLARVYAEHGRVQTANVTSTLVLEEESPFFLENKEGKVTRVAQTIFRLWKSHGFTGNLNPTHIRYTAATKACETLNPVSKRGVATLMAHAVATQEHYYNALQADNAAVNSSMLVRQSICQ
ncbi:hypothetical protein BSL78_07822, partial [Apostichopus japonicus]